MKNTRELHLLEGCGKKERDGLKSSQAVTMCYPRKYDIRKGMFDKSEHDETRDLP